MKIEHKRFVKTIISLSIITVMLSTTSFAAWWGLPGYEWARSKGITTLSNNSALNNVVSHDNFYSILIKYLRYKNVQPKENVTQDTGESHSFNKAIDGIVAHVDEYISKTSLTPNEYRSVATYIDHITATLQEQSALLNRDDLKDVYLYLSLAKYKAATLISEYPYQVYVLNSLGPVKYKELVTYNIKPYYGEITRKEFLVLMYSLLSKQDSISPDQVIEDFIDAGVIEGYDPQAPGEDNRLSRGLTYAEMFKFMLSFETFDFNPVQETESGDTEDEVIEIN